MNSGIGDQRFRDVFRTIDRHVESVYGIPIIISDVPHPFTGDLDGAEIRVDYDLDAEEGVFVAAHLFGHTVQWNLSPESRLIGLRNQRESDPNELKRLQAYEDEACRYSLQMFHDAQIDDLDQWMSDFAACDWAYLAHFYRTGEKLPFRSFWRDGCRRIEPLSIPPFRPRRWVSRWGGIVV
jgi:hypothetical protein